MSRWLDMAVVPEFSWPNVPVEIPFQGEVFVLSPSTDTLACTISAYDPSGNLDFPEGARRIRRPLSCLAWAHRARIVELFCIGTNLPDRPGLMGTGNFARSFWQQTPPSDYMYLPDVTEPKAKRALALFREGLSVNSDSFAFLSHFKVLNVLFSSGPEQKAWINANLRHVQSYNGTGRLASLRQSGVTDIGAYLYHQGRCAVAHAFDANIVDPDDYEATDRLSDDLGLMEELAFVCIERDFNVPSSDAFWSSHRRLLPNLYKTLLQKQHAEGERVRYVVV
jgi:hypothetical protein